MHESGYIMWAYGQTSDNQVSPLSRGVLVENLVR